MAKVTTGMTRIAPGGRPRQPAGRVAGRDRIDDGTDQGDQRDRRACSGDDGDGEDDDGTDAAGEVGAIAGHLGGGRGEIEQGQADQDHRQAGHEHVRDGGSGARLRHERHGEDDKPGEGRAGQRPSKHQFVWVDGDRTRDGQEGDGQQGQEQARPPRSPCAVR